MDLNNLIERTVTNKHLQKRQDEKMLSILLFFCETLINLFGNGGPN